MIDDKQVLDRLAIIYNASVEREKKSITITADRFMKFMRLDTNPYKFMKYFQDTKDIYFLTNPVKMCPQTQNQCRADANP